MLPPGRLHVRPVNAPAPRPVILEGLRKLHLAALSLAAALTLCRGRLAQAQQVDIRAEEAAIRALVNGSDCPPYTEDAIFWSGAYPQPLIGTRDSANVKPHPEARMDQRRNTKATNEIVRLEVAAAGDMAYEFSNFTLSYDMADTQQHLSFPGSMLRVWKKVNGQQGARTRVRRVAQRLVRGVRHVRASVARRPIGDSRRPNAPPAARSRGTLHCRHALHPKEIWRMALPH